MHLITQTFSHTVASVTGSGHSTSHNLFSNPTDLERDLISSDVAISFIFNQGQSNCPCLKAELHEILIHAYVCI